MTEAFQFAFPRFKRKKRRGRQLRPPRMGRFEDRYAARLIAFLDLITATVDRELSPQLQGIVQEQAADEILVPPIRLDDAADKIARIFKRVTVFVEQDITLPRIAQQAARTGKEVNDANSDFNTENVRAALGVSVFPTEPWLVTEMDAFVHENASLIQGVNEEQLRDIEQSVFRNVRAGASAANIQADILAIVDRNKKRARLIARDQINKFNGRLSELRQKSLGVKEYHWRTAQEERVRPTHAVLDGTVQEWAQAPVTVRSGRRAGETNHPGGDIQCLPIDSNVVLRQGAIKLFRRAYSGKLTTLVADDGTAVSATPHHPILTERGWIGIGSVEVGENVFKARRQRGLVRKDDVDQPDILIGDVFDAALKVFPAPMGGAGIGRQFHGDGTDEEVHVINTDGSLANEPDALLDHYVCEKILTRADKNIPEIFLGALSPAEFALVGLWPTSDSIVRGARKLFSLFTSQLSHACEHRAAAISWLNPILQQAIADNGSAHSVFFGDSVLAFPGKIVGDDRFAVHILSIVRSVSFAGGRIDTPTAEELGECVGVATDGRRGVFDAGAISHQSLRVVDRFDRDHNGPVFNMETAGGWYVADDYILKNCRCIAEPIFPDEL